MNIKIGILNVPKLVNKYDLIHFVTQPGNSTPTPLKKKLLNKNVSALISINRWLEKQQHY